MAHVDAKAEYDKLHKDPYTPSALSRADTVNARRQRMLALSYDPNEAVGTYEDQVMRQDVAMWYGAITTGPTEYRQTLKRFFSILQYGGLSVKRDGAYRPWYNGGNGAPIAVPLSHGGRVMVQLPLVRNEIGARKDEFWKWLWHSPERRFSATHGLSMRDDRVPLPGADSYLLLEEGHGMGAALKLKQTRVGIKLGADKRDPGNHYGLNVGLGGIGQQNPWSGATISTDGTHGHLYVFYYPPTEYEVGGLLFGCEGSAPPDRYKGLLKIQPKKRLDQTGAVHGFSGGSSRFSPTGGLKWSDEYKVKIGGEKAHVKGANWHSVGPTVKREAFVVDLSRYLGGRSMAAEVMNRSRRFLPEMVGGCGEPFA